MCRVCMAIKVVMLTIKKSKNATHLTIRLFDEQTNNIGSSLGRDMYTYGMKHNSNKGFKFYQDDWYKKQTGDTYFY